MSRSSDSRAVCEIIRDFLAQPSDRNTQNRFVELCLREAESYIKWRLSLSGSLQSPQKSGLSSLDIAVDIIGILTAPVDGQVCHIPLTSLYKRFGDEIETESDDVVVAYFRGMIRRYCAQEYANLAAKDCPEIAKLRKAFKTALKSEGINQDKQGIVEIGSEQVSSEIISFDILYTIVREAFTDSNGRPEWVRRILLAIKNDPDLPKRIRFRDLISAAVAVNSEFMDLTDTRGKLSEADCITIRRIVKEIMDSCLESSSTPEIGRFIDKGRISGEDAARVSHVIENIAVDFSFDGSCNSFPSYLKEIDPEFTQEHYQKHFKFVIDTVARVTIECISENMGNDPTIRQFWSYL